MTFFPKGHSRYNKDKDNKKRLKSAQLPIRNLFRISTSKQLHVTAYPQLDEKHYKVGKVPGKSLWFFTLILLQFDDAEYFTLLSASDYGTLSFNSLNLHSDMRNWIVVLQARTYK